MKGGVENNLHGGIALRSIEARGRLRLAKDIGDTVVADPVAGAKVGVRIVVKGAPSNPAGVLRIRGKLIVDPSVAQGMFPLTLIVVCRLGGVGMANEFSVKVEWVIGLAKRKIKIIDGEDVFEQLGFFERSNTAGLPRRIECVSEPVGPGIETVVIG